MKFDARSDYLFVAGGPSGAATVYDADSGTEIAYSSSCHQVFPEWNDVVVTREAAYFTDTTRPFLGRVALGNRGEPGEGKLISAPQNFGVPGGAPWTTGQRQRDRRDSERKTSHPRSHERRIELYLLDTKTLTRLSDRREWR